jgi:hypothetical protein
MLNGVIADGHANGIDSFFGHDLVAEVRYCGRPF